MGLVREHTHVLAMTRMPEVPVLMMMRAQWKNLKISSVEVSARLRVERPKSGLPLDLGLKIIMDGRVRYHNLIEYNFIHIRIYLCRAIFFHFVFRFRFRLPIFRTDTLGLTETPMNFYKGSDLTDAWQTASCDYPWTLRNFRA